MKAAFTGPLNDKSHLNHHPAVARQLPELNLRIYSQSHPYRAAEYVHVRCKFMECSAFKGFLPDTMRAFSSDRVSAFIWAPGISPLKESE